MNRHYTASEYKELCEKLRNTFSNASLTTDVMVGFHDETEEDFIDSLKFVKSIKFEKVHVFPYSQRNGTVASKRGDNVPKQVKEKRAGIMIDETEKIRREYLESLINKNVEVLFENEVEKGIYQGYTKTYLPVRIHSDNNLIGKIIDVKIKDYCDDYCIAE
jgi:threonylcarbamoyladenosine tRNA methylthiotransferase MtaB